MNHKCAESGCDIAAGEWIDIVDGIKLIDWESHGLYIRKMGDMWCLLDTVTIIGIEIEENVRINPLLIAVDRGEGYLLPAFRKKEFDVFLCIAML